MTFDNNVLPIICFDKKIIYEPFHWHDNFLAIILVRDGIVRIKNKGMNSFLSKDDIFIVNPGDVHRLEGISDNNLVSVIIIDNDFISRIISHYKHSFFLCNSSKYENLAKEHYAQLRILILELIDYYRLGNIDIDTLKMHAINILQILDCTFDFITCGIKHKKFSKKLINRYRSIYGYVVDTSDPIDSYSIKVIADSLNLSYSYLRQDITDRFGVGYNWLKACVLVDRAARLLLSTNDNITSVCHSCSFSDPKYMIKYFKQFYDCTPSEFRATYGSI